MTKKSKKNKPKNRSNKSSQKPRHKKPPQKPQLQKTSKVILKVWKAIAGLSVLLSLITSLYLFYPRLSLSVGDPIEPLNPFYTKFVLNNIGYFPIKDISFICGINSVTRPDGKPLMSNLGIAIADEEINNLEPNTKSRIAINRIFSRDTKIGSADIMVDIKYKYYLLPFHKKLSQRFITEIDNKGNLVWIPTHLK